MSLERGVPRQGGIFPTNLELSAAIMALSTEPYLTDRSLPQRMHSHIFFEYVVAHIKLQGSGMQ